MKLILSISFIFTSFVLYSQNLILNSSFEQNGEPVCDGWYAGCCVPLGNPCDTFPTYGATMIYTDIADSIRGNWGVELYGNFPTPGFIVTYIPAKEGTNIYQLKFWMNSINFAGGGGINLKRNQSSEIKWVEDWGQPWTQYSLLDTITCGPNDTLYVILSASLGDFCICDVQFDQIEFAMIDSIPTATPSLSNDDHYSISPNPAFNYIHVQTTALSSFMITLYDMAGKQVFHQTSDSDQLLIDSSGFLPGIYVYEISIDDQKKKVGRILKM